MGFFRDGRLIAIGGGLVALAAGLAIAWFILAHSRAPSGPPPASQGGLVVVSGRDDDAKLDPKRPLRCFVGGQFVGELPLAACASRNGVATGALDVGLDPSGALAATNDVGAKPLTPLQSTEPPPVAPEPTNEAVPGAAPAAASRTAALMGSGRFADCWRYATAGWRPIPPSTLPICVQNLYAGRCPGPDAVYYGRWGDETLRLSGGRVEISSNNRDFSSLVDPWPPCVAGQG